MQPRFGRLEFSVDVVDAPGCRFGCEFRLLPHDREPAKKAGIHGDTTSRTNGPGGNIFQKLSLFDGCLLTQHTRPSGISMAFMHLQCRGNRARAEAEERSMKAIAVPWLFLVGLSVASAQTVSPVPLPSPSPFPSASVIYQWDYTCPNVTAASACFSSLGFPVAAVSVFLVEFPVGSSTALMSCYIATLTTQSAGTGWNTSCTQTSTGFSFSQRGMTLHYAGNPNHASAQTNSQ